MVPANDPMNRRALLLALGAGAALAWTRAWTQPAKSPRRIAFLSPATREHRQPNLDVFRSALKDPARRRSDRIVRG